MENTLENKVKFFAQYWGLNIGKCNSHHKNVISRIAESSISDIDYIELKPLSSITDEDACEISMLLVGWQNSQSRLKPENIKVRGRIDGDHSWDKLIMEFQGAFKYTVRYRGDDFMVWIDSNGRCEWNSNNHLQVYDFLRSKGYALPFMGLSVENQIEYGWIKLKTEDNGK